MAFDPLAPIRLGLRVGIGVLRFELRVVEHLLGLDRDQPDVVVAEPERFQPEPAPPSQAAAPPPSEAAAPPRRAPSRSAATRPEPEPIAFVRELELSPEPPAHIDTEPELVGEFAESGAEEGAGPEIHVAEPWDGYKRMRVADIRDRVTAAEPAELAIVQLYEASHRNRRSVLDAVERRSKQLADAPASR